MSRDINSSIDWENEKFTVYEYDAIPGPMGGSKESVLWYSEKGVITHPKLPHDLRFYGIPKIGGILVGSPDHRFNNRLIQGENLGKAVAQWVHIYETTPEML